MIIINGWFPHIKVHQMTFVQRMVTQRDREAIIDYFCVSKELKKFLVDVKVKRGAHICSYHHLVLMRMGVKGTKWKRNRYRLCIEILKREEGRTMYTTKLEEYRITEVGQSIKEEWRNNESCRREPWKEEMWWKRKKWWNYRGIGTQKEG
jgi:hypothetical protein